MRGGRVRTHLRDLEETMSAADVNLERRSERLERLLCGATRSVPFYADCDPSIGLSGFPIIDRVTIKSRYDDFKSRDHLGERLVSVSTSGSSGEPLTMALTRGKRARQIAEYLFFSRWGGYELGRRHVHCRASRKGVVSRFAENQVVFDPTHLTPERLGRWRDILRRGRVKAVIGHPSALDLLADCCAAAGDGPEDFKHLSGIILIGETIFPAVRDRIESVFGLLPLGRYASAELGVLAHEVPGENRYMVNSSGYVIEVLGLDDDDPVEPGGLGRVVVTDLLAPAMPLIRYDIGDLAVRSDAVDRLGLPMLDRVEGRLRDIIIAPNGTMISPFAFSYFMRTFNEVTQFQFVQEAPSRYRMSIIPGTGFGAEPAIRSGIERILGPGADFRIEHTDSIPSLPSGKRTDVMRLDWAEGE